MGKKLAITAVEIEKIKNEYLKGNSIKDICANLGWGRTTVYDALSGKLENRKATGKQMGRPTKLSPRIKRHILRMVDLDPTVRVRAISKELQFEVGKTTIDNFLNGNGVKSKRMKSKPILNKNHKKKRFEYTYNMLKQRADITSILFTDEKRFCLDGPDGNRRLWVRNNRTNDYKLLVRRQNGGPSLMVWSGFMGTEKAPLIFFEENVNSKVYVNKLEEIVIPWLGTLDSLPSFFQQDNAPAHVSEYTLGRFKQLDLTTFKWPPHSPDLNPVELVWAELSRCIYRGDKQYGSLVDLKKR